MATIYESNPLEIEAAMCLWEAFDAMTLNTAPSGIFTTFRENYGSAESRSQMAHLIEPMLMVRAAFDADDWHMSGLDSYDWDFVPWFLKNCVNASEGYGNPFFTLKPDWREICKKQIASGKRRKWLETARSYSRDYWGYAELLDDLPEDFESEMEAGKTPFQAVLDLGRETGLSEPDPLRERDCSSRWDSQIKAMAESHT